MTKMLDTSLFLKDLINEKPLVISQLLLKHYTDIGMDETELAVILHLIRFRECQGKNFPTISELEKIMTLSADQIRSTLARLIEKGLLVVEHAQSGMHHGKSVYVMDPLWDRLLLSWHKSKASNATEKKTSSDHLKEVYKHFEKEFGRYLSPIESDMIVEWCSKSGFTSDLILEALKRAVLQGALSFKYIDTILRSWADQKVQTVEDIDKYDKKFKDKRPASKTTFTKSKQKSSDKYSEIYVT